MKKLSVFLYTLALGSAFYSCSTAKQDTPQTDYTQYVDPFIGAADNGHTFPGACRPFGMIQTSPVTGAVGWRYCSEYMYADSIIWGFTQTHLNGTGCMDLGDILVMPFTGERHRTWDAYRSSFSKTSENATPGYYTVTLDQAKVKAELTATTHAALHRYTYEQADSASILIDLQHGPAWNEKQYHSQVNSCEVNWENDSTLTGHVNNKVWVDQDYYFVMQFSRPVIDHFELPMAEIEKGKRLVASFNIQPGEEVLMKVALSTTGVEGAKANMAAEVPEWDFEGIRTAAKADWNSYLSRIEVEGTDEEKTNFYTSFYHALIQPNEISDVDGRYRNAADSVVNATGGKFYSTFSLWDTYRAAHPFYTLMVPERVDGFINSLVDQAEVQGYLPIWGLWGKENFCMVANHGVSVVAEAYAKGFRGFDAERAFNAIKQTQTVSHPLKSNWENYMKYGYFPTDLTEAESVSSTLESVYDDYAAADMAKRMGKTEDAAYFARRADFYKNLFDSSTQFMRPKKSDGTWKSPFNPSQIGHAESVGGDYTEGNAWQYTWHVQHDVPGLIALFGGEEPFLNKLDSLFTLKLETTQADVTGLIGQYAHGNEPSHHVTYLYALAGRPERTQELIREIFDTQYSPKPNGLCGNDDCGQMSAWYMFSAMGFYPVNPVSGEYVFGAPQLPEFVLHLADGKTFTIKAEGLSEANKYVKSITLNGEPYTKNFISHADIVKGGTLVYQMTDKK
ncbi:MAG TPA: alpha-mannosidase [Bacteroides sp.]|jgi:predicted alpha-1,2-mannosidase|uniref:GH92 family glycosyl hydrolase n=1 Tax=Phocaeicola coprocola TaxID=310298 RepID=UPI000EB9A432|nr:GH92 family glycosyl hydrolase [Phocaeicola coprocola]HCM10712.1 alpha-mannosidase [Bacteroides sp.]